ncbi:MAG: hypothetical protein DRK00_01515 [Thermoprotei archaeon]|nr:MAG: hypothetical protein DRK00_01515 [Thermoprotei archaeon]
MSLERCSECGGRLVISPEGFPVCSNCGLVAQELVFDWSMPLSGDIKGRIYLGGWEEGSVIVNHLLGSQHRKVSERLVKLNIIAKYGDGKSADREVFRELAVICRMLRLPRDAREHAFIIYRKLTKILKDAVTGRKVTHFKVAAAALALSSRSEGRPIPPLKIAKAFRARGHLVSPSDIMMIVHLARHRGEVPRYTTRDMLRVCASTLAKLGVKIDEAAVRDAEEILNRVPRHFVSGRDTHLLALAALYLSLKRRGVSVSYYKLARVTRRAASSIRANVKLLEGILQVREAAIALR